MTRGVRLDDLSPAVRDRIRRDLDHLEQQPLPKAKKNRTVARGHTTWRCHRCGHTTDVWAQAERHAWTERHVRIEIVL